MWHDAIERFAETREWDAHDKMALLWVWWAAWNDGRERGSAAES